MPTEQLSLSEEKLIAEMEAIIERGKWAFVQVGQALLEIRARRLYRDTHGTFEDYCKERWGWGRKIASDYILAAGVAGNVTSTLHTPISLTQARELASLEPEQQRAVAATTDFANTSAKKVKARVDEVRNPKAKGAAGIVTPTLLSPRGGILPSANEEPRPEPGMSMVRAEALCQACRERLFPHEYPKQPPVEVELVPVEPNSPAAERQYVADDEYPFDVEPDDDEQVLRGEL